MEIMRVNTRFVSCTTIMVRFSSAVLRMHTGLELFDEAYARDTHIVPCTIISVHVSSCSATYTDLEFSGRDMCDSVNSSQS